MNDTSAEISDLIRNRLSALSGAERVLIGSRMFDAARSIVLASLPVNLSEIETKGRLCQRIYGSEADVGGFIEHLKIVHQQNLVGGEALGDEFWKMPAPKISARDARRVVEDERRED